MKHFISASIFFHKAIQIYVDKAMLRYILKRLLNALLVLLGLSLVVFITLRLTGDPVAMMLQAGSPSKADIAEMRRLLDLDKSLPVQYLSFLEKVVVGDFGRSFRYSTPALGLVLERMPATLTLTLAAMAVGILLAFPLGIVSALNRGKLIDFFSQTLSLVGVSMPNFWFGILLILIFGVSLQWLPVSGSDGPQFLVLPAVALGIPLMAVLARILRSSMLEILNADYIRTARAKGLARNSVVIKHALRNALVPVITVIGLQFGTLLGGAVIVETVFSWPGVGRLAVDSISSRDYPVVQTAVLLLGAILVLVNLIVDILYTVIDPRISAQ